MKHFGKHVVVELTMLDGTKKSFPLDVYGKDVNGNLPENENPSKEQLDGDLANQLLRVVDPSEVDTKSIEIHLINDIVTEV